MRTIEDYIRQYEESAELRELLAAYNNLSESQKKLALPFLVAIMESSKEVKLIELNRNKLILSEDVQEYATDEEIRTLETTADQIIQRIREDYLDTEENREGDNLQADADQADLWSRMKAEQVSGSYYY